MYCPKICVRKSSIPAAGYGVFATQDIRPGELLETAPFIEVPFQTVYSHENSLLRDYVFASHRKPRHVLIVFGKGSMYNCSPKPNAAYMINGKDPGRLLDYYALKPIRSGEEILIDYAREEVG